jgi:hypothetical protein
LDEGDLYKYLRRIGAGRSGLYVIDNSEFLEWAAKENSFEEVPAGLRHFLVVSTDDVVEVLAFDAPIVLRAEG